MRDPGQLAQPARIGARPQFRRRAVPSDADSARSVRPLGV